MESIDLIRSAQQQSQRWRDLLWESVLDELEERNPIAAAAARTAARERPGRPLYGASTEDASAAWPLLDVDARLDWIWVCQFVNRTWVRTFQEILTSSLNNNAA